MSTQSGIHAKHTRRDFFRGAGGAAGALLLGEGQLAPAPIANPNILIIMVDQLRYPTWLTQSQRSYVDSYVTPNISGRIRNKSVSFNNYFVAAASCTPSRSTILTGLYTPQTGIYETGPSAPGLSSAFPTWGNALPALNPAYADNVWWFGKWHLTPFIGAADPLLPYGFRTSLYPSANYRSPDGVINEGTRGGTYTYGSSPVFLASDADITDDFLNWMSQPQTGPWCATVSLINPHDIFDYPAAFPPNSYPPSVLPICSRACFPQPPGPPSPYVYSALPTKWNFESPDQLAAKQIQLQTLFQQEWNTQSGEVTDWVGFLNWYFWLQHCVDKQIGRVLDAVANSSAASNTVIVFTSDHGDYAGSHGLHGKSGAAYDEAIHAPLYVCFPGGVAGTRQQLCSSVDFFGLVCDVGTGGSHQWATVYPDLARRESIYNFIHSATQPEQRRISPELGVPYVLHTTDESIDTLPNTPLKNHLVCLRTRTQPADANHGAKYAAYNQWAAGAVTPDSTVTPDQEFYDYAINPYELGNDALSSDSSTAALRDQYRQALGAYSSSSGAIALELTRPLTGTGTNGQPLRAIQKRAQQGYLNYIAAGGCSA
jgi:arylsulfatase A-like enzyme